MSLDRWPEPVYVIGIDTAWLAGDDNDTGRLLLTDAQLMRLATDAPGAPLPGLCLALMHHPFHDLGDGEDTRRLVADHLDVVLRGHLHQAGLMTWQDPDPSFTEFAVGCLNGGHGADRFDAFPVGPARRPPRGPPVRKKQRPFGPIATAPRRILASSRAG